VKIGWPIMNSTAWAMLEDDLSGGQIARRVRLSAAASPIRR
jgi:hypothetical protein